MENLSQFVAIRQYYANENKESDIVKALDVLILNIINEVNKQATIVQPVVEIPHKPAWEQA